MTSPDQDPSARLDDALGPSSAADDHELVDLTPADLPDTPNGDDELDVDETFDEIGRGHRWYDPLYSLLRILQYQPLFKSNLPESVRRHLYYASNYLMQHNQVKRYQALGPRGSFDQISIPVDEHVTIPSIWAVEYFAPSQINALNTAIRLNHWDRRQHGGLAEPMIETLRKSRQGNGYSWWRIADIYSPYSGWIYPDGYREDLPEQISSVELKGVTVGDSLTAVIAHFRMHPSAWEGVDAVWHADHIPAIATAKGRLAVAEGKKWVTFRRTQEARAELHQVARTWLRDRCPGAFVEAGQPQPLADLVLLTVADPTLATRPDRGTGDILRALGLTESQVTQVTSPHLPGLVLEQARQDMVPGLDARQLWSLWGQKEHVASNIDLASHGGDADWGISHVVDDRARTFLVRLGLTHLLDLLTKQSATARDEARARHGRFGRRDLRQLRHSFLTTSLDVASITKDIRRYGEPAARREEEVQFSIDYAVWFREEDQRAGRTVAAPIDFNAKIIQRQDAKAREVEAFDRDYRDILSTVASLGASIDAFKVQRYAVFIAFASTLLALLTLWISLGGQAPFGFDFGKWFEGLTS